MAKETLLPRGITGNDYTDRELGCVIGANIESTNPLTGASAGTQAAATKLLAANNVVKAGGGANASVILKTPSVEGECQCIFNISGFPINVYGGGSDTINGLAAQVAASQMNNSVVYYTCVDITAGVATWLAVGLGTGYAASGNGSFPTYSYVDNLAPTATGTQATATLVSTSTAGITPAAGTDAVRLPPAKAGMEVTVINKAAGFALTIFPASAAQGGVAGGDNFNNQAQNAALTGGVPAATVLLFYCLTDGTFWSK